MDIHKPKRLHNLREFASEVVVIVVGVAIALGGEQAVGAVHWRNQVAEYECAVGREIAQNLGRHAAACGFRTASTIGWISWR